MALSNMHVPPLAVFVGITFLPFVLPSWISYLLMTGSLCFVANMYLPKPRQRKRAMSFFSESMLKPFDKTVLPGMPSPIINGCIYFDQLPDLATTKTAFASSFLKYVRFHSVPEPGPGSYVWVDRGCNIDDHFIESSVDSADDVKAYIDDVMAKDLRLGALQPLWEVHMVKCRGDGASVCVFRVHHSLGDGISLMKVFLGMLKRADGSPYPMPSAFQRKGSRAKPGVVKLIADFLGAFKTVLMLPVGAYDTDTAFTTPDKPKLVYTGTRTVVQFPEVQLDWIKKMKDVAGVTVNDVLMSATAGAIRRYCLHRKDTSVDSPNVLMRALLPLSFPRDTLSDDLEYYKGLRNLWCFVSAKLLIGEADPRKRLAQTSVVTNRLKTTPQAPIQMGLQNVVLPLLPTKQGHQTFHDLASRHSMVFSNVPGPTEEVFVAGVPVKTLQMVYPNILTQVGILSYNGHVSMNMVLDPELIKESHKLPEFYLEELKAMGESLGCPGSNQ